MIQKSIFGEDHADVATSYSNLATVYSRLGEYNQAKELHEKALMIRKSIFGEDHADVATSYSNLATVYSRLGKYNQAKELHEKALMMLKRFSVKIMPTLPRVITTRQPQSALRRRTRKARQKISVWFVE